MTNSDSSDAVAEVDVIIDGITNEADGIISLTFASLTGDKMPRWEPGAHIDVLLGPELERQYSLCGDVNDERTLRVAVLREPDSRGGSQWVHERLSVGDKIRIRGPRNHFRLVEAQEYLFIAGGIGITPILPMIADCEARGSRWSLVYGGRSTDSMAFTTQLAKHQDRVRFWPQDENGHIDIRGFLGDPRPGTAIYCCGPGPLLDAVEDVCSQWPTDALHLERFRPRAGAMEGPESPFEVELEQSNMVVTVAVGQTIVDACKSAGVHIPTSCGEGTCGTCETVVLEGVPEHRDSYLTAQERESNEVVMPCCSRSRTSRLVLDL
ncbi:Flavodoxin reductases (ferredoxin-NADPH reductases) family 1; Vanillate O-demethylase oxidoreductase [Rhodococcus wratislaviensis]|uniref:Flavodoxin reductases (Ferredoxin-NADPH reductases) family 1 Vanillate O-demethylase oxidoreductase n=1 Tax=Rhodococcus wratislaviensis TaxID=44752 RepID=A0A402C2X3_RHOWR|nr:PDR/VanB family oxidoreductase [Rhodococcus wratislaviensis]GCE37917.1 Flavodoxin reductases (ferredoxin-NADPH reductases) family 1; Vanillate O-demethylase oxidoreductase [Rhodococcus wratislaviensis]